MAIDDYCPWCSTSHRKVIHELEDGTRIYRLHDGGAIYHIAVKEGSVSITRN